MHPRLSQYLLIIAGLWLFLYGSFTVLSPVLLDGADALHAEIAREMIERGDPVSLYANGARTVERAPLLYWSTAASMRAFGVGAAQARLPLAVFVLFLALLVEHFARHAFRSLRAGLYAAVCLLLSPGLFVLTRILVPDLGATLWLTAAVFCFWLTEHRPAERNGDAPLLPCLGCAAACALNILTGGLPGLLLAVGIVLIYLVLTRGVRGTLRRCAQMHPLISTGVFLLIAAPWQVLAAQAGTGGLVLHGSDGHAEVSLLRSVCLLPVWVWPWSLFLWPALRAVPWRSRALLPEQKSLLLLGIAALLPFTFLLLPHRRVYDVLPSLPFLAMLVARWLDREAAEAEAMTVPAPLGRAGLRLSSPLLVCGAAAALVCAFVLWGTAASAPGKGGDALTYVRLLSRDASTMAAIRGPAILAAAAMFLGTLGGWWYRRNYCPHVGNVALAAGVGACLTMSHVAFTAVSPMLSSQPLAASLQAMLHPSNLIVINGDYRSAASLGFYLGRTDLHVLDVGNTRPQADATARETYESLDRKWPQPERIFLWTDPVNLPALPGKVYVVAEAGGKQIVSNKAGPY